MSGVRKALPIAIGIGGLFQQTTAEDIASAQQNGSWANMTSAGKAQFVINRFIGRITFGSLNPFNKIPLNGGGAVTYLGAPKPSLNIANIFNKWTGMGVGAMIYGHLPWKVPEKGLARKIGIAALFAGVVGGLLDDPIAPASSVPSSNAVNGAGISRSPMGSVAFTSVNS